MYPVNLNPTTVPMSRGDLARLKSLVKKTLSSAKKIGNKTMAEQSIQFGGKMENVTIGDINLTINISSKIIDNLHEVKNIVDKMAIAPTPQKLPASAPKCIEYRGNSIELEDLNLGRIKRRIIQIALDKHNGNRTHAADDLGISLRAFRGCELHKRNAI